MCLKHLLKSDPVTVVLFFRCRYWPLTYKHRLCVTSRDRAAIESFVVSECVCVCVCVSVRFGAHSLALGCVVYLNWKRFSNILINVVP